jgi:hypothetical protein
LKRSRPCPLPPEINDGRSPTQLRIAAGTQPGVPARSDSEDGLLTRKEMEREGNAAQDGGRVAS